MTRTRTGSFPRHSKSGDTVIQDSIARVIAGWRATRPELNVEPIAIMIRKDDPKFKAAVDDYIRKAMKDGEIRILYDKWFLKPIPPKNVPVNLPMGKVLSELVKNPNDKPAEAFNNQQ